MNVTHHLHLISVFHSLVFGPAYLFLAYCSGIFSSITTHSGILLVLNLYSEVCTSFLFWYSSFVAAETQKFGIQKTGFKNWLTTVVQLNLDILVIDYLLL